MPNGTPWDTACDTDPDSPCNRQVPDPPFFCSSGNPPDPVCLNLCLAQFRAAVDAAQFLACGAVAAACNAREAAEQFCQDWGERCIEEGNDPAVCEASVRACMGQAKVDYDTALEAADAAFSFAVAQAKVAFYACAAQCCYEN